MAKDLGVAQPTLSCWESGARTPTIKMIYKIINYLNITGDYMFEDLTKGDRNIQDEIEILISKNKDILTDDDKELIKFIIQNRKG